MHDEHLGLGLFDLDPERAHRDNGVHAIVAAGKAAQDAWSVGERRDHDCAMRNALVARDSDLRFDPRRAFYPKVIHGLEKRRPIRRLVRKRREESQVAPKCPALWRERSSRAVRSRLRSEARDSLGDEKDLVRVRIAHFGARREAAHVHIALVRVRMDW